MSGNFIYNLDRLKPSSIGGGALVGRKVFMDGVLKGDYSLAIVNRELAAALIDGGIDLSLFTAEQDWKSDELLKQRSDVRARCMDSYPKDTRFDIHLRNTWPPSCRGMIGTINAYVCFAWEEAEFPQHIVSEFNEHLDLVMVTSRFVETALRQSGVTIPVYTVGNGTDHLGKSAKLKGHNVARGQVKRILHVSSCFPRKGADILVRSFAKEFKRVDNVELLIKTFDNPHNDIKSKIADAISEFPDAAPIELISTNLSSEELAALIKSADLLVAPSRGEGFGLPLAEALLLDVPVATTNYSGQLDFCRPETAWLFEHHLVPSSAHVAGSDSLWAEPSAEGLGKVMRQAIEMQALSQKKASLGKTLLTKHFKWSDVVRRVGAAISEFEQSNFRTLSDIANANKITLVSSWEQVCGIATYSHHLFETPALAPTLARVLGREHRGDVCSTILGGTQAHVSVERPWGYDRAGIERLAAALQADTSPIIWIQHHPGFFSNEDMSFILKSARRTSSRMIIATLHNAKALLQGGADPDWLADLDIVFVHNANDAQIITSRISGTNVKVIPHGILKFDLTNDPPSGNFTIGNFGFLLPHKNIPKLLMGFYLAQQFDPRFKLKLLNCVRHELGSQREAAIIREMIIQLGLSSSVDFREEFLEDHEIINELQRCNLLCFPYGESDESATGAVRIALAANRPLLCSQESVLRDIHHCSLQLQSLEPKVIAEALLTIASCPEIANIFDLKRNKFAERYSYERIAVRYLQTIEDHLTL